MADQTHEDAAADDQAQAVAASHPAHDPDPRANTTDAMNRIDFNDPIKTGAELAADLAEAPKAE